MVSQQKLPAVTSVSLIYFYFILKQELLPPQAQIHIINIRIADIR
jgi:hypothetical protein